MSPKTKPPEIRSAQVRAAVIKAASDWAVFLSEKPAAGTRSSQKSLTQLDTYFNDAYWHMATSIAEYLGGA